MQSQNDIDAGAAETAGEATVDSAPAERDSTERENGLDVNAEEGLHFSGPLYRIDGTPQPLPEDEVSE